MQDLVRILLREKYVENWEITRSMDWLREGTIYLYDVHIEYGVRFYFYYSDFDFV